MPLDYHPVISEEERTEILSIGDSIIKIETHDKALAEMWVLFVHYMSNEGSLKKCIDRFQGLDYYNVADYLNAIFREVDSKITKA